MSLEVAKAVIGSAEATNLARLVRDLGKAMASGPPEVRRLDRDMRVTFENARSEQVRLADDSMEFITAITNAAENFSEANLEDVKVQLAGGDFRDLEAMLERQAQQFPNICMVKTRCDKRCKEAKEIASEAETRCSQFICDAEKRWTAWVIGSIAATATLAIATGGCVLFLTGAAWKVLAFVVGGLATGGSGYFGHKKSGEINKHLDCLRKVQLLLHGKVLPLVSRLQESLATLNRLQVEANQLVEATRSILSNPTQGSTRELKDRVSCLSGKWGGVRNEAHQTGQTLEELKRIWQDMKEPLEPDCRAVKQHGE